MKWSLPIWPAGIVLAFAVGALIQLFAHHGGLPAWMATQAFWLGGDGILGVLISAATLLGVVIAAIQFRHSAAEARLRREMDKKAEQLAAMQRATQLLSSDGLVSQGSGIYALRQLSAISPSMFRDEAVKALSSFVNQKSQSTVHDIREAVDSGNDIPQNRTQYDSITSDAIIAISDILDGSRSFTIRFPYLDYYTFSNKNFRRSHWVNFFSEMTTFVRCNFDNASMRIYYAKDLSFRRCSLVGAEILLRKWGEDAIVIRGGNLSGVHIQCQDRPIELSGCLVEGATIVAEQISMIDCWVREKSPTLGSYGKQVGEKISVSLVGESDEEPPVDGVFVPPTRTKRRSVTVGSAWVIHRPDVTD